MAHSAGSYNRPVMRRAIMRGKHSHSELCGETKTDTLPRHLSVWTTHNLLAYFIIQVAFT